MGSKIQFYFLIILVSLQFIQINTLKKNPFKHVITLVMENHSYDNMLGYMEAPIGSLNKKENCNTYLKKEYCQSAGCDFQTDPNPAQYYGDVNQQMYGNPLGPMPGQLPNMNGFAANYGVMKGGNPQNVFDCYTPEQVPIISSLAKHFTTYDNWFSSVPSCTDPNKLFMHAASSGGNLYNCKFWYCAQWPVELNTIQMQMQDEGFSWAIHWMDWCEAMGITPLNQEPEKFVWDEGLEDLYKKLENGTLENYVNIVPRIYTDTVEDPETGEQVILQPNTQHPSEDVRYGEQLMKEVYENFRKSKYWEDTLLLVVYDEHGGFYDHVTPPLDVSNPTPGEHTVEFNWERLGIRVPSIAISPWLNNTVDSTQLEHSSIPKTIRDIFQLKSEALSSRETESSEFLTDNLILDEMRTDCPMTLPEVPFGNDSLYKFNPENHKEKTEELNGTPKNLVSVMGTLLVKQGILNTLKFQQISEQIKSDGQAIQFVKEAQVLLGYRPAKYLKFQFLHEQMKVEE